jgi:hypothetical protein
VKGRVAPVLLGVAAACGGAQGGTIRVTIERPQLDAVELELAGAAKPCASGGGRMLTGTNGLQGMLVWIVTEGGPDSVAFPINRGADSVPVPHARVSLRYLIGDVAHAIALDSGTVEVRPERQGGITVGGSVVGSGFDSGENLRPLVRATFQGIRVLPDSATCG